MRKDRWLIVSAFVLFLAETGLQMSGLQNLYISFAIWGVMFLLLVWAMVPTIRGIWSEIKSWTEPQKTLAVLISCIFITSWVLMILAARRTLLGEIKRDQRVEWMIGLEDTTPTVVEKNIAAWLHKSPYSVKRETYLNSMWHFAFTVQPNSDRLVTVGQLKQEDLSRFNFLRRRFEFQQ